MEKAKKIVARPCLAHAAQCREISPLELAARLISLEHVAATSGFAFSAPRAYLTCMFKFEFCLPTTGKVVPSAPEWFHESNTKAFASAWSATVIACG